MNECTKAAILLISFPVGKRQIFTTLLSINILFPSVKKIARSDMLSLDIPVRFLESAFYGKSNLPDFGKTVYKDFLENSGFLHSKLRRLQLDGFSIPFYRIQLVVG